MARFSPSELIFNGDFLEQKSACSFVKDKLNCSTNLLDDEDLGYQDSEGMILRHFGVSDLAKISLDDKPYCQMAVSSMLYYLSQTQKTAWNGCYYSILHENQYMNLDLIARRNLGIDPDHANRGKRGSPFMGAGFGSRTAMGKRMIKSFIEQPH